MADHRVAVRFVLACMWEGGWDGRCGGPGIIDITCYRENWISRQTPSYKRNIIETICAASKINVGIYCTTCTPALCLPIVHWNIVSGFPMNLPILTRKYTGIIYTEQKLSTLQTDHIHAIIIYRYKIAILHHGMQSFHILGYCTPVYCTLVYCTIGDSSDRFATSISLREHANERYVAQNIS